MAKLSHCCKALVEESDWNNRQIQEPPPPDIICTKCHYYCEEWKEKRDLEKEFFDRFKNLSVRELYYSIDNIWQWVTDNFIPKSKS